MASPGQGNKKSPYSFRIRGHRIGEHRTVTTEPFGRHGVQLNVGRLRREMAIRGLNGAELAELAGISTATMSAAMQGRWISTHTLRKLALALARVGVVPGCDDLLDTA